MTHHLYALLVGINEYDRRSRVPSLNGCTNDAKAMKAYLETRVASHKTQLHAKILLDEQATRQAIIDGFRAHLQQANEGDTVLFYYAGHGSQNRSPQEFWPIMPSRLNETLVCYDSRVSDSWDLADKELSKLIAEVGKQNPHITVVLDCCHSGSGTRSDEKSVFAKRKIPIDRRDRPASSFLISAQELAQAEKAAAEKSTPAIAQRSLDSTNSGWHLPQGRHILMAACRETEEASEYQVRGQPCGAFSHFLLDTLQKTNSSLTYRDLFNATSAKTQASVSAQAPQIEASYLEDLEQPFLGGLVEPFPAYFTLAHSPSLGWCINGGAVHGIQSPINDEMTQLALFSIETQPEDLHQLKGAIANATVTRVQPQLSQISTAAELDTRSTYKAIITYLPVPPLNVVLEGDPSSLKKLRQAMQTSTTVAASASYLKEVADIASAEIRVVASPSEYTIERVQAHSRPIAAVKTADAVIHLLAHIARWIGIADLAPPPGNQLAANAVELQVYYKDRLLETEQIQLAYEQQAQQWRPPSFKAKLINNSNRPLYCALLNLTEEYSVSAPFFSSGGTWLEAHSEIWVTIINGTQLSDLIPTTVPQELWEQGVSEYRDRLKLVASTAEFDPVVLLQNKVSSADAVTHRSLPSSKNNLFRQFAKQTASRDIGTAEAVETVDQWLTSQRLISTVKPQPDVQISAESTIAFTTTDVNRRMERIAIGPHAQLKAKVRLTSTAQNTRSIDPSLPPLLKQTQPLLFSARRSAAPSLDALELREIEGAESVTPDSPLTVMLDASLAPGESVLPVAYDGEFFIPLGYGRRQGAQTEVVLQRLPQLSRSADFEPGGTRSISSALRIVFRKVAAKTLGETLSQELGMAFEYPILAAVEKQEKQGEALTYTTNIDKIRDRVTQSKNIAICIHGIIGSTQTMASAFQSACMDGSVQGPAGEGYDLILTYDYESLNTSIAISAVQLKQKLAAIGILPGHTKTVHIVAHSMGGLIGRWLIEKERGGELIQHLIMMGTPNAGSSWSVVQAGLFRTLSFAANGLSTVAWPLRLVKEMLTAIESADVTLDEIMPDSDLLTLLAASEPPIPYSIVAGNTSLIPIDEQATLRTRLEEKINQLIELPFLQEANDMAVSVSSIRQVPAGRSSLQKAARSPDSEVLEVACNHFSYFLDPAGLAGLSWAVNRAFTVTE